MSVDEARQDRKGQLGVGQLAPRIQLGTGDLRVSFRQIEATVRRQTAKEDVTEGLGSRLTRVEM